MVGVELGGWEDLFRIGTSILFLAFLDGSEKINKQYFKVDPGLTRNISGIKKALDLTLRLSFIWLPRTGSNRRPND